MQPSQGPLTGLMKKLLFRQFIRHPRLQHVWSRLHTLSVFGMNYGGGGLIEASGEKWALENAVRPECKDVASPVVFDVGANVGDDSLLVRRHLPNAVVSAIEPATSVCEELAKRVRAEGDQIRPFNVGFSDAERTVELYSYTLEGKEVSLLSSIDPRLPTQTGEMKVRASLASQSSSSSWGPLTSIRVLTSTISGRCSRTTVTSTGSSPRASCRSPVTGSISKSP